MRTERLAPERWTFAGAEPYTGVADHRGLLQIHHPWVDSRAGACAQWQALVRIPAEWTGPGPVYLSFYHSDTYGGTRHEDPSWLGVQAFRGHRFKQLLVNGRLLWEEDVAEEEMAEPTPETAGLGYREPYQVVALPGDLGHELDIVLRLVDRVASTTVLADDQYFRYSWGTADPERTRYHFHTHAFFGDVALTTTAAPVRAGSRVPGRPVPAPAPVPLPPEGTRLALQVPGALPSIGYPVRCGVPLPQGVVARGTPFALHAPSGQSVPVAVLETSHWRDGSVRWVLCEFVAREAGDWRLLPGTPAAPVPDPVSVSADPGAGLTVRQGSLCLRFGAPDGPGLFAEIAVAGQTRLGAGRLSLKLNRVGWAEAFQGVRCEAVVERASPICAVIRLRGDLRSPQGTRFGPWTARLQVWAGLPCVFVEWGVVNESDQATAMILDWSARFALPGMTGALADFGAFETPTPAQWEADAWYHASKATYSLPDLHAIPLVENSYFTCRQESATLARVLSVQNWVGAAVRAPGYVRLNHGAHGMVAAMRWFADEFPKGIALRPHELQLATLPEAVESQAWAHDVPWVHIGRGEGKRQAMALWLAESPVQAADAERFTACLNDPPCLFERAAFRASRALETGPDEALPGSAAGAASRGRLAAWEAAVAPVLAWSGIDLVRQGHREYWDTAWMNNYRSRAHAGLLRYVETGEPRWRRYFDAACRHLCDVDIIHFCPEHPEWVGSIHQWSVNHTSGPASSNIGLGSDDLLEHYLLTGDVESLEAARGLAERILDCPVWSRSARAVGWPLAQVSRWHDQTGDPRFLAKAREFLGAARAYTEPRRGVFTEIHGSWNYHGSVPFMTCYLAFGLIRYHQLTGEPQALDLLCLLADGVLAECQTAPGRVRYSPNPEGNLVGMAASTCGWSVNLGGLYGYVFLHTGNPVYAAGLEDCYQAVLAHPEEIALDMVELQGWLLQALVAGKEGVA